MDSTSSQKVKLDNNLKKASREEYTGSEIKKLSNNVALFCLCESRHGKKIKKAVIVEHVLHGRSKHFNRIMKFAKQKLTSSFGLSVLDVDDNGFLVINKMENALLTSDAVERNSNRNLDVVILKIALLAIIMNKGSIYESNLLEIIRRTGVLSTHITNVKNNEEYIKKLLQKKFVEKMLLECKECERPSVPPPLPLPPDGKIYEYKVGIRAKYGISKEKLRDYIVDLYGTLPRSFPSDHYEELFC